jgi:8-oxo-dGTP pyrophosphatase MutT (NUDIX family)
LSEEKAKKDGYAPSGIRPWPLVTSKVIHTFSIYALRQDTRQSPRTGKNHEFLVLDSRDWINVVPVTPSGNLVLIRQFRHGTASMVWEIPGGMMDPGDANPEHAARRELLEETGYEPEDMVFLGAVHPNPAIQNNRCHTFLARNARPLRAQRLDTSEDIEVREASWPEVARMVDEGQITHSLVLTALFWYRRHLTNQKPPPSSSPGESSISVRGGVSCKEHG